MIPQFARVARPPSCEADLPPAGQLDIDLGEQLCIEQRAVLDPVAAIDPVAGAQGVERVLGAGMAAAGERQRVDHPLERKPGWPQAPSSKLRKPKSNCGVVRHQR